MTHQDDHLTKIRDQFSRQTEAYKRLKYVADEKGHKRLVAISGAGADDSVLDVACGPGFLTIAFAELCKAVTGVDATDTFLEAARQEAANRELTNITFIQGDVEHLDEDFGPFDVTVSRAAFHHFPRPDAVLREMKRVTKPGGAILITDMLTSEDPKQAAYHHELEQLCDPTHARALTESQFEKLFQDAGLTLMEKRRGESGYSLSEWIDHGGPSSETTDKIHAMMKADLDQKLSGLRVWEEEGEIHLAHLGCVFVLCNA